MGEKETDSAGVTCEYTPIEDLKPGDVVIIGWRETVAHIEVKGDQVRVVWERWPLPDQWNPRGTLMPVEVVSEGAVR